MNELEVNNEDNLLNNEGNQLNYEHFQMNNVDKELINQQFEDNRIIYRR